MMNLPSVRSDLARVPRSARSVTWLFDSNSWRWRGDIPGQGSRYSIGSSGFWRTGSGPHGNRFWLWSLRKRWSNGTGLDSVRTGARFR